MSELIYLDHHATTPVDPRVVAAMQPYWTERFGNAASLSHKAGEQARKIVAEARHCLANGLQCRPDEIVFTSGATEANNIAIKGLFSPGTTQHFITNAAEHRSVLDPARRLKRQGVKVTVLSVDPNGNVSPQQVADAIAPETSLVSVMWANNEVGSINPIKEIVEICHDRKILVHSDASQVVGKLPLSLMEVEVDFMSFTAHKMYGPKGIGALYVRKQGAGPRLQPLFDGGGQEQGLRSGTLPVPLIVGFAEAFSISIDLMQVESVRLEMLRDQLWNYLEQNHHVHRNGHASYSLAGNLNVTFPGINGDALLARLSTSNLCVSSGAACSSANPEPSHVLQAIGLSEDAAKASLRFGIGRFNTKAEIDQAAEIVTQHVSALEITSLKF